MLFCMQYRIVFVDCSAWVYCLFICLWRLDSCGLVLQVLSPFSVFLSVNLIISPTISLCEMKDTYLGWPSFNKDHIRLCLVLLSHSHRLCLSGFCVYERGLVGERFSLILMSMAPPSGHIGCKRYHLKGNTTYRLYLNEKIRLNYMGCFFFHPIISWKKWKYKKSPSWAQGPFFWEWENYVHRKLYL